MSRESDLMFGLVALRMKLITGRQLLESASLWLNDLDMAALSGGVPRTLAAILKELRHLDEAGCKTVSAALEADGGSPTLECGIREALLELRPPGEVRAWLHGLQVRPEESGSFTPVPREERYDLVREIGRGGLGRVMEARDRHLGRELAVKLVRDDMPADARERFVREARITARLDHPNIVPVYDFDELLGPDGGKRLMLCMKRVTGRDLGSLLKEIQCDPEKASRWSQARLLRMFQDICLGMAFAHDRGILHRDLKPANVLIGDYGETLIVDWGLAREQGSGDMAPRPGMTQAADAPSPDLTLEGDVLGTPMYMSPEQAAGKISEVDARSDIYALGAILHTILTYQAPFSGSTREEVIRNVLSGRIAPPSRVVRELRAVPRAPAGGQALPEPVSPDLDAICSRALAHRKEDRYGSARELHEEIQLFLEGVKERERKQKEAREWVERGREHFARYHALRGEIEGQNKVVAEWSEKIKPHQTPVEKRPLWDAEARLQALQEERIGAFSNASAEFGQALAVDPASVDASDGKCELFLDRFLEAEKKRDRNEMLLNRNMLLQYDRNGRYRANLDAPGKLSLRTFAYGCDCLRPVRHPEWRVEISEKPAIPWRDGRPRPDMMLEDKDCPVPAVKTYPEGVRWGHTDACPRHELPGVEVLIAKYEERDRRLVLGEERRLGVTPLADVELPQGSYRCTLRPPDPARTEVLLPVLIPRGGRWDQDVNVYCASDIPAGFRYVPGGPFTFQGEWAGGGDAETRRTEDLFVAEFPVTCAEYLEFLNDLCASARGEEAGTRQPREGDRRSWIKEGGRFRLPTAAEDQKMAWDPRWPIFCIDLFDSIAYAAWRSKRDGVSYRLLHEEEYEKATRGVDGRVFSYGDVYDGSYSHTNVSVPGKISPLPVGTFSVDQSPYGIRDLSGGMVAWGWNSLRVPFRDWHSLRGGAWCNTPSRSRACSRYGNPPAFLNSIAGVRLAAAAVPRTS